MIANKKNARPKSPSVKHEDERTKSQDELDNKRKDVREKTKATRVNYIVKDLPIY